MSNNIRNGNADKANLTLVSKLTAAVAVICILFLPVVGCGGANLTGVDIIKTREIGDSIKIFMVISVVCGVIILFLKQYIHLALTAVAGVVSLLISYLIARDKVEGVELKTGAFLAIIGYMATAIIGFLNNKPPGDNPD